MSLDRSSGGGQSREEVIEAAAKDIFSKCPKPFDLDVVTVKYPTKYEESMNTVLTQECIRYNALLTVMAKSLAESIKALKGLVVMSPELEGVCDALFNNQVTHPSLEAYISFPSILQSYFSMHWDQCSSQHALISLWRSGVTQSGTNICNASGARHVGRQGISINEAMLKLGS